jgi:putative NADH-flavin reductase
MRLFVVGATGRTGAEVVDLALARGHEVTAFVRSPHKLAVRERLRAVRGDPRSTESIREALPGHDAVISAIGPSMRDAVLPSTLLTDCAASTIAAMATSGVRRLTIVSAALLFDERGMFIQLLRLLIGQHLRDLRAMEALVGASGLSWTIARPPRLVDGPEHPYRAAAGALPEGERVVTFRTVAAFLLDSVERGQHQGEIVGLTRS